MNPMAQFTVPHPLERPDYVFYHTPTTQELRERAVQAMRDHLSIQWATANKLVYSKTGPVSGKLSGTVTCNYPMAVLKVILTKENGAEIMAARHLFTKMEVESGVARRYELKEFSDSLSSLQGKSLRLEVTATNGEVAIPVMVTL